MVGFFKKKSKSPGDAEKSADSDTKSLKSGKGKSSTLSLPSDRVRSSSVPNGTADAPRTEDHKQALEDAATARRRASAAPAIYTAEDPLIAAAAAKTAKQRASDGSLAVSHEDGDNLSKKSFDSSATTADGESPVVTFCPPKKVMGVRALNLAPGGDAEFMAKLAARRKAE
eukprot:Selendium_serpulae@DN4741_c0_g1_i2.p1